MNYYDHITNMVTLTGVESQRNISITETKFVYPTIVTTNSEGECPSDYEFDDEDGNLKPQTSSHSPASQGGHSGKAPGSSKARQKKFHRHFQQVAEEERVINYYSCALVSDILLQGHLYITNNYFAFYSNVFGFVTKLLIPIASVLKISKEKTARIIPNAVGVATLDEKHVFGSFMSRDAAHRLMLQVWRAARPAADEEISGQDIIRSGDLECSECSADDYSSGSGSGTESPPVPLPVSVASPVSALCRTAARPRALKGAAPAIPSQAHHTQNGATGTVATDHSKRSGSTLLTIIDSMPRHTLLLLVSTALLALLFISAGVLLYRIGQVHHRAHLRGLESSGGEDLYGEVLRWQAELHSQSASEVQNVLDSHLHQIAKVRQSLEALSMLIVSEEASQNKHSSNS